MSFTTFCGDSKKFYYLPEMGFYRNKNLYQKMFNRLMTIEEVANYLRVKKRTVYDWLKKGKIPAIKTVGQWRFKREQIDAWLDGKR